jgi:hypothetical protein
MMKREMESINNFEEATLWKRNAWKMVKPMALKY